MKVMLGCVLEWAIVSFNFYLHFPMGTCPWLQVIIGLLMKKKSVLEVMCVTRTSTQPFSPWLKFPELFKAICTGINQLDTKQASTLFRCLLFYRPPQSLNSYEWSSSSPLSLSSSPPPLFITVPLVYSFIYSQPSLGHRWPHSSLRLCLPSWPNRGTTHSPVSSAVR